MFDDEAGKPRGAVSMLSSFSEDKKKHDADFMVYVILLPFLFILYDVIILYTFMCVCFFMILKGYESSTVLQLPCSGVTGLYVSSPRLTLTITSRTATFGSRTEKTNGFLQLSWLLPLLQNFKI